MQRQEFQIYPPIGEDMLRLAREHQPGIAQTEDRAAQPCHNWRGLHLSLSVRFISSRLISILQFLRSPWLSTGSWPTSLCVFGFLCLQTRLSPQRRLFVYAEGTIRQHTARRCNIICRAGRETIWQIPAYTPVNIAISRASLAWTICGEERETLTWMGRWTARRGLYHTLEEPLRLPCLLSCRSLIVDNQGVIVSCLWLALYRHNCRDQSEQKSHVVSGKRLTPGQSGHGADHPGAQHPAGYNGPLWARQTGPGRANLFLLFALMEL
jgi:hypothetical protein